MTYSFRLRLELDNPGRIRIDEPETTLSAGNGQVVRLKTSQGVPFTEASDIVVVGSGYRSEAEAEDDGHCWQSALVIGLAHNNVSAALRLRDSLGGFSDFALDRFRSTFPPDGPAQIHNEVPGVQTFMTGRPAFFASGSANVTVSPDPQRLFNSIRRARATGVQATPEQLLAFEMYNASFRTAAADVRLVCLTMAIEILIRQEPRSEAEQAVIREAIESARHLNIEPAARDSFIGSLSHLLDESITSAGRRLARTLGDLTYLGEPAETFFTRCYAMRSVLVHGGSGRPTKSDVDRRATSLGVYVGDLISVPVLGARPNRLPENLL